MRAGTTFNPVVVNFVYHKRGLGDIIVSFKVIQTIRKNWPHVFPIIWVPDFCEDLAKHMLADYEKEVENVDYLGVFPWKDYKEKFEPKLPTRNFKTQNLNTWRIPLMIHNYLWMTDYFPTKEERDMPLFDPSNINIDKFDLPKKYVVLGVTHNAENKEFYTHHIEKIRDYLNSRGIATVYVGNTNSETVEPGGLVKAHYGGNTNLKGGINLVDKTNLKEVGAIMAKAKAVVGVDSGLIHLAACTNTPIVCGFTVVRPDLFTPQRRGVPGWKYRTVEPDKDLGCRFCHSQINFINHGDVFKCFYKDRLCLDQMTGDKFIKKLEALI